MNLTWVDWAIVIVVAASVLGGLSQGLFRSVCSLLGLVFGLAIAAWNYGRVAAFLLPIVRSEEISNAIAFLLIAFLVMGIASIIGALASRALQSIGLGCLDRLAGGVFGFIQGALVVTISILVIVAFFPNAHWLADARLSRYFFRLCHMTTSVTPTELAERIRHGLILMEERAPEWMHPPAG